MPKSTRLLFCLAILCLSITGHADVTLEVAVQSPAGSGTQTFHVAGKQLRMDIQLGLTRSSVLYDGSTDNLTLIDHQAQAFVRVSPEQASRLGQTTRSTTANWEVVDSGRVRDLGNGVSCRIYGIHDANRQVRETCLTEYQSVGLTQEDYQVFTGLLTALERMAGDTTGKATRLAGKLPLRTVDFAADGRTEVTELRTVKQGVGEVSFQVPSSYVEESPF